MAMVEGVLPAVPAISVALLVGYLLTWGARWLAPRVGLIDKPDQGRKRHARPTPVMGGVAVFFTILLATAILRYVLPHSTASVDFLNRVLISAGLFCLLGVIDDKWALRPRTKLLGQIVASLPFVAGANAVSIVEFLGVEVHLGIFGGLFTILWLVACTNIVNLIDGLDGLASTISFVAAITIAALSLLGNDVTTAHLSLIVAAAVIGFLIHNWPPAKIFLGDSGSLTIGFLVGALAFEASLKKAAVFTLTVPVVVMSVPAFDTLMAIVRRRLTGRRIGDADRGHIHHRLQDHGLSKLQTLMAIGGLSLLVSTAGILATYLDNDLIAAMACFGIFSLVVASRLFGFHETQLVFRHVQALQGLFSNTLGMAGTRLMLARLEDIDRGQLETMWQQMCRRLAKMGIYRFQVACEDNRNGSNDYQRDWIIGDNVFSQRCTWRLVYSVQRDPNCKVTITSDGSSPKIDKLPQMDDVFLIFHTMCSAWPFEVETAQPTILTFPTPVPAGDVQTDVAASKAA